MVTLQFRRIQHGVEYAEHTLGSYEWVQVTFNAICVSPSGEPVATFADGVWTIDDGVLPANLPGSQWTDFIVYASDAEPPKGG